MKIIPMTKKHIPCVIEVLKEAFNDSSLKRRGLARERKRTAESIIPYIENEPEGCLVALEKNKVVGAIFGHVWGKIGWIGTFGVDPEFQGKGVGKELMLKITDFLDKKKNVTYLGLETMPDSNSNIGLYCKLGFKPAFQTISLIRPIIDSPRKNQEFTNFALENNLEISYFSQEENKDEVYTRCQWLAEKIENGLDHSFEMKIANEYKYGETIFVKHEGFIVAYAICRLKDRYEETTPEQSLTVKIIVTDKDIKEPKLLDYILLACEKFGLKNNKTEIKLSINSSYWLTFQHLISNGFRVRSALLRMVKFSEDIRAYDHQHEWLVNCASFTM
ncbi:MAG: GNAT family N-acetyltransferase [Candidatus Heimdallarchaeota archaeon]|nr:GNAT family N-acetyltransferase [Candidatus Heimdallarchaeota archaeon]